jgi:phosphate transport system substrate-binding protein
MSPLPPCRTAHPRRNGAAPTRYPPQRIRGLFAAAWCLGLGLCLGAAAADLNQRRHILIVGSSTAYPIIAAAAEIIGRNTGLPTPVVESTGSGGGIKLFCAGLGLTTPDIAMTSRRMKDSERAVCNRNHVNDVREIKIGYDGIVIANRKDAPAFRLSGKTLYLALAREVPAPGNPAELTPNPYLRWQEIDAALPDVPIRVLGPPPTSGTRDILVERVLESACLEVPILKAMHAQDPTAFAQHCQALREDGAYVNAGENDARLVRKLIDDPGAVGIFGYSFLDQNRDRLQGASFDGVAPEFELIESGVYPLSRPMYLYVKPQHARVVRGLDAFVDAVTAPEASGPDGYLVDRGLIPLPARERRTSR